LWFFTFIFFGDNGFKFADFCDEFGFGELHILIVECCGLSRGGRLRAEAPVPIGIGEDLFANISDVLD
jgi:hypothetical protein